MARGSPGAEIRVTVATPSSFRASDRHDPRFYIIGTLIGGILRFEVVTRLTTGIRSAVKGRDLFDAMLSHFGARVRTIEGRWTHQFGRTTNLDIFNQATGVGLPEEQAALLTKTGGWADDHGYSTVTVVDLNPPRAAGKYREVIVHFSR